MATNGIDVCNLAIMELGGSPITAFEEQGDVQALLRASYPSIIRGLMTRYNWECFKKRVELTRSAEKPIGKAYKFLLPGDKISAIIAAYAGDGDFERGINDFEVMGGNTVITNHKRLFIDYVASMTEDQWPPYFLDLAVAAVGARIAFFITDQQSTADAWQGRAFGTPSEQGQGGLFGLATTLDAQGSGNNPGLDDSAFISARMGW